MSLSDLWNGFLDVFRASKPKATKMTLTAMATGSVGTNVSVICKLVRVSGMAPIPNATVVVTVTPPSGTVWTVSKVTDVNGQFSVSVPLAVQGSYVVKGDYAGEPNKYQPSSSSVTITALPVAIVTTLKLVPSATEGHVGDNIVINATLTT